MRGWGDDKGSGKPCFARGLGCNLLGGDLKPVTAGERDGGWGGGAVLTKMSPEEPVGTHS